MVLKPNASHRKKGGPNLGLPPRRFVGGKPGWLATDTGPTIVAVDLDGVLGDQVPHVLRLLRLNSGIALPRGVVTHWDSKVGDIGFDRLIGEYLHLPSFVRTMPVVVGARRGMRGLSHLARVVVLTKRPRDSAAPTRQWVARNFGRGVEVEVLSRGRKSDYPARILIDDNLQNVMDFVESAPRRVGILYARPWNSDRAAAFSLMKARRIVVAKSWPEVTRTVRRLLLGPHRKTE